MPMGSKNTYEKCHPTVIRQSNNYKHAQHTNRVIATSPRKGTFESEGPIRSAPRPNSSRSLQPAVIYTHNARSSYLNRWGLAPMFARLHSCMFTGTVAPLLIRPPPPSAFLCPLCLATYTDMVWRCECMHVSTRMHGMVQTIPSRYAEQEHRARFNIPPVRGEGVWSLFSHRVVRDGCGSFSGYGMAAQRSTGSSSSNGMVAQRSTASVSLCRSWQQCIHAWSCERSSHEQPRPARSAAPPPHARPRPTSAARRRRPSWRHAWPRRRRPPRAPSGSRTRSRGTASQPGFPGV